MADSDVIRKLRVYRALYRMNRAFAHLTRNLDDLLVGQFLKNDHFYDGQPASWQDQLGEIQASINRHLTENLNNLEHGDVKRFGRFIEMAPQVRKLHFPEKVEERPARTRKRR